MSTAAPGPSMRAMQLQAPGDAEKHPLHLVRRACPKPSKGEALVQVEVCGVCRTDLHVVEGDLPPHHSHVVPGHEVVGRIESLGPSSGTSALAVGDRVGVAWLHRSCGICRFCRRGAENLCTQPSFTGWDVDGGYAEYLTAHQDFVYPLPERADPLHIAPLLCAGIIGYRAYQRCSLRPGGRLGIFGFGGSAHVVLQIARHRGNPVYVFSRNAGHQQLARELGATWVGGTLAPPPEPLDAAILFAPAGEIVPIALAVLDRGGVLAVAGIHLSDVPHLDYQRHLFQERELRSVTANTREDGRELLRLAFEIPVETHVVSYPLEQANQALVDLKQDRIRGAAVLDLSL